jgi:hypothetical protein
MKTKVRLPSIKVLAEAIDKMLDTPYGTEDITIGEALYSYYFKRDRIKAAEVLKEEIIRLTLGESNGKAKT